MTRTEMFEQLVAKLTADNARLVSDLRNLDELFRNATNQSNRATQALVDERADNARLREVLAEYADHGNWDGQPTSYGSDDLAYDIWMGNDDKHGWETAAAALANETPTR